MPFRRKEYPQNWEAIRERILTRANHACERCGVKNYAVGYRVQGKWIEHAVCSSYKEARARARELNTPSDDLFIERHKYIVIVLTIAHLNPNPMDVREENLLALCQAEHLALDSRLHAVRAQQTREKKKQDRLMHKKWGRQHYAQDAFF